MRLINQIENCINGESFQFGTTTFYRLTVPDEKIDSIHYKTCCGMDAALIASWYEYKFDIKSVLMAIYHQRKYFRQGHKEYFKQKREANK